MMRCNYYTDPNLIKTEFYVRKLIEKEGKKKTGSV